MTLDNSLNNTQSTPNTANPQGAGEANNASNAADFQQTAPSDVLKDRTQDLNVQDTGAQLPVNEAAINWTPWLLGLGIVVLLAALVVAARQFMAAREGAEPIPAPAKSKAAASKKKPSRTKSVKSGKPVKRAKKRR